MGFSRALIHHSQASFTINQKSPMITMMNKPFSAMMSQPSPCLNHQAYHGATELLLPWGHLLWTSAALGVLPELPPAMAIMDDDSWLMIIILYHSRNGDHHVSIWFNMIQYDYETLTVVMIMIIDDICWGCTTVNYDHDSERWIVISIIMLNNRN